MQTVMRGKILLQLGRNLSTSGMSSFPGCMFRQVMILQFWTRSHFHQALVPSLHGPMMRAHIMLMTIVNLGGSKWANLLLLTKRGMVHHAWLQDLHLQITVMGALLMAKRPQISFSKQVQPGMDTLTTTTSSLRLQSTWTSAKNIGQMRNISLSMIMPQLIVNCPIMLYLLGKCQRTPKEGCNWDVQVVEKGPDGKPIPGPNRKPKKKIICMGPAYFENGQHQDLYFPEGHPHAGVFNGMAIILEERGYTWACDLHAECKKFKCPQDVHFCCCYRVLYNEPDFINVKSLLEEHCEKQGFCVLFFSQVSLRAKLS